LRYKALRMASGRCECCGASPADGIRLNVDHIQPRKRRPDLALDPWNLQVLCDDCNAGKGNWDESDWR
jgi:5-methylcytosine-specific restriction endonuclease McrA